MFKWLRKKKKHPISNPVSHGESEMTSGSSNTNVEEKSSKKDIYQKERLDQIRENFPKKENSVLTKELNETSIVLKVMTSKDGNEESGNPVASKSTSTDNKLEINESKVLVTLNKRKDKISTINNDPDKKKGDILIEKIDSNSPSSNNTEELGNTLDFDINTPKELNQLANNFQDKINAEKQSIRGEEKDAKPEEADVKAETQIKNPIIFVEVNINTEKESDKLVEEDGKGKEEGARPEEVDVTAEKQIENPSIPEEVKINTEIKSDKLEEEDAKPEEAGVKAEKQMENPVITEEVNINTKNKSDKLEEEDGRDKEDAKLEEAYVKAEKQIENPFIPEEININTENKSDKLVEEEEDARPKEADVKAEKKIENPFILEEVNINTENKSDKLEEENGRNKEEDAKLKEVDIKAPKQIENSIIPEEVNINTEKKRDKLEEENGKDKHEDAKPEKADVKAQKQIENPFIPLEVTIHTEKKSDTDDEENGKAVEEDVEPEHVDAKAKRQSENSIISPEGNKNVDNSRTNSTNTLNNPNNVKNVDDSTSKNEHEKRESINAKNTCVEDFVTKELHNTSSKFIHKNNTIITNVGTNEDKVEDLDNTKENSVMGDDVSKPKLSEDEIINKILDKVADYEKRVMSSKYNTEEYHKLYVELVDVTKALDKISTLVNSDIRSRKRQALKTIISLQDQLEEKAQ